MNKYLFTTILVLVSVVMLGFANKTDAQNAPEFLISWKAESYAPASFSGKLLPTEGTHIAASFEILVDGKLVDVSQKTIYWYLNDKLLRGGKGIQSVSFFARAAGAPFDVRVQFDDYFYNNEVVLQTFTVPVVEPEVVIEAPFPGGAVSGSLVKVAGRPYFFNTKDPYLLEYSWEANGQKATDLENPGELEVVSQKAPPSGTELKIGLTIQDLENAMAQARKIISLVFK